jgi:hypothetical protein
LSSPTDGNQPEFIPNIGAASLTDSADWFCSNEFDASDLFGCISKYSGVREKIIPGGKSDKSEEIKKNR